jgi:hypothetical protein
MIFRGIPSKAAEIGSLLYVSTRECVQAPPGNPPDGGPGGKDSWLVWIELSIPIGHQGGSHAQHVLPPRSIVRR